MKIHVFSGEYRRVTLGVSLILALVVALMSGCEKPVLDDLDPNSGTPGTVVEVIGENLTLASVKWDAGTGSEQTIPSGFLAAQFFTVPPGASIGIHPVRLYKDGEYSDNTVNFTVTSGVTRPNPRLDDVTVVGFSIDSGGRASMALLAHGANIDIGAQIRIDGTAQSAGFYRLLRNTNMNAADPSTLGYPIFHYTTVFCILGNQTPGDDITVSVENLDGNVSNDLTYHIAADMTELDSDGDGLPDRWEENGYDADGDGTVDVDLPALGADPMRKDLFIEVDWMSAAAPNATIWTPIEDAFANAPVLNSDGSQGIAIHIDRGATTGGGGGDIIPYADGIRYDDAVPNPLLTYVNLYTVKASNFDADRLNIYRYCVFAWDSGHTPGSSGRAEGFVANDFFVSLGSWGADGLRDEFQLSTFMHELGHTLNLRHGGFENTNSKDNYNSIMNYGNGWITWSGLSNVYSPSQMGGIDVDCDLLDVDSVYTYSQGQRRNLDESNLDENEGMCDSVARDWNENGVMEASVSVNIDSSAALTVIEDHADWANIEINFRAPGSDWNSN